MTAHYHKPYNTHKNRMYSDLANEQPTILPFILHHQNKLHKAQDCCYVILSTILLERTSPVIGQVFKKCQNVIYW